MVRLQKMNADHEKRTTQCQEGLHDGLLKLSGPIIFKMKQPDSKFFPGAKQRGEKKQN